MTKLTSFSQYSLVPVLTEWLTVRDFLCFDSSFCNSVLRSWFIALIRAYPVKFYVVCVPPGMISVNSKCLLWLNERNLKLLSVLLHGERLVEYPFDLLEPLKAMKQVEIISFNSDLFKLCRPKFFVERYLIHVIHLNISFVGYLSSVLDCIAQNCHQLKTLRLEILEPGGIDKRIKLHTLIEVCRSCQKLQSLDLPHCDVSLESIFCTIIVHCRRYSTLVMPSEARLFDMFLCHSRCSLTRFSCININAKHLWCLLHIGSHHSSLTSLSLPRSDVLDNVMICEITKVCPRMLNLDISDSPRATSTCLVFIAMRYPGLTSLNIMGICFVDCNHLTVLTSNCRQLRELRFNDLYTAYYQSNQEALLSIALYCPRLVILSVVHSNLSQWILLEILRNCPNLRELDVSNNYKLIPAFFHVYHLYFLGLKSINVKGCLEKRALDELMSKRKLNLICQ